MTRIDLAALNALPPDAFASLLAPVYEHAAWVAQGVTGPFGSLTQLHQAMTAVLNAAPEQAVLAFLRGHPALSPRALPPGTTADSVAEQHSAGLAGLPDEAGARLVAANAAYAARFGFPFILAVRNATAATILAALERRLHATPDAERAEALREVEAISWMRLLERVVPAPTGGLSLHVLDTARTRPAAGLGVELWGGGDRLAAFVTDAGGAGRQAAHRWRPDRRQLRMAAGHRRLLRRPGPPDPGPQLPPCRHRPVRGLEPGAAFPRAGPADAGFLHHLSRQLTGAGLPAPIQPPRRRHHHGQGGEQGGRSGQQGIALQPQHHVQDREQQPQAPRRTIPPGAPGA